MHSNILSRLWLTRPIILFASFYQEKPLHIVLSPKTNQTLKYQLQTKYSSFFVFHNNIFFVWLLEKHDTVTFSNSAFGCKRKGRSTMLGMINHSTKLKKNYIFEASERFLLRYKFTLLIQFSKGWWKLSSNFCMWVLEELFDYM